MLEKVPEIEEIEALVGEERFLIWTKLCALIDRKYDMERSWNNGGKAWKYEYKYRRGGKTLCALYARENCIGFMVIFGAAERERFEKRRMEFSSGVQKSYDEAETYRDGKWVMFLPGDTSGIDDFVKLLEIKRKPNRKQKEKIER